MQLQTPESLAEIRKKFKTLHDIAAKKPQVHTLLDKLAVWITEHVGSMGFFLLIFGWTILWLGWNTLAPHAWRFDSFPAFALWLFISNVIQIFLMPLIMVGQNIQGQQDEMRAQADFEINTKAEAEIEAIFQHLENQNLLLNEILKRLDAKQ